MLRFCIFAVILALASAKPEILNPNENFNQFEEAAPRQGQYDSYGAPLADPISSGESWGNSAPAFSQTTYGMLSCSILFH